MMLTGLLLSLVGSAEPLTLEVPATDGALKAACDRLATLRAEQPGRPVTLRLADGTHRLTEPLRLGPEHTGAPVVLEPAPGARPVLDGGRRLTGWVKGEGGVWTVHLPEVAAGRWSFRMLWADGIRQPRARLPKTGFKIVAGCPQGTPKTVNYHKDCDAFEYAPGDIDPRWTNLEDVEVIVYHFWTDSHLPIATIDEARRLVTFKHKAGKVFTDDFTENGARYVVENVFEALSEPGEWYLNRRTGVLSWLPPAGLDPNAVEVVAPVAPALLELTGDPANRRLVTDLTLRRLAFRHTWFELPAGDSNDRQGSASVSAAIRLKGAERITFEHCDIGPLGGFAIELGDGCRDNVFRANRLHDLAAGGCRVNGATGANPLLRTGGNRFEDNEIGPYGVEFPSAVGLLLQNTEGNTVAHNEIHHGGYTGISLGWVWGYGRSVAWGNLVEGNHIHHIGGLLSDMGGIYTLGVSPGTVLRGNVVHHVDANHYGGWGIYCDEGSTHLLIEHNLTYDTKFAGFNIHFAKEVWVRNNIFALGRLEQVSRTRLEPHQSVYFEQNIVYWTEGELYSKNWRDEPYTFHFRPLEGGRREVTSTFEADGNLYFNPTSSLEATRFNGRTFAEWQAAGKDKRAVWADPLFVDVAGRDFRLRPESPALALGFRPFDPRTAGPRVTPGRE